MDGWMDGRTDECTDTNQWENALLVKQKLFHKIDICERKMLSPMDDLHTNLWPPRHPPHPFLFDLFSFPWQNLQLKLRNKRVKKLETSFHWLRQFRLCMNLDFPSKLWIKFCEIHNIISFQMKLFVQTCAWKSREWNLTLHNLKLESLGF